MKFLQWIFKAGFVKKLIVKIYEILKASTTVIDYLVTQLQGSPAGNNYIPQLQNVKNAVLNIIKGIEIVANKVGIQLPQVTAGVACAASVNNLNKLLAELNNLIEEEK